VLRIDPLRPFFGWKTDMTKILISELDRIILKNSERRVIRQDDAGYVLARLGQNVDLHEHFTHDEIVKLIDAGEMSIEKNWHQESPAPPRLHRS
jgi:putative transposase